MYCSFQGLVVSEEYIGTLLTNKMPLHIPSLVLLHTNSYSFEQGTVQMASVYIDTVP